MKIKKYKMFLEATKKSQMWDIIPDSVKELHDLFQESGKKLFVVGGSVRDYLNGDKPKDFDLATDASPEEVLKIVGKKWRTTLQGKSFFVVVVYTEDQPAGMEIATFREDVYGDLLGKTRNPEVKFSTIDKDVERRDITYNALFYDLDKKEIIDLVGGIEDLENGITKFVGDPNMRIKEDPLRIMRILRFSNRYNFQIEESTAKSIIENKGQLNIITRNRIWEEIFKAWKTLESTGRELDFKKYLDYFNEFDLWNDVFPGSTPNKEIKECKNLEIYLANIFKNEPTNRLQHKLVQTYVIPDEIARVVHFLVWLQQLTPEKVLEFNDKRVSYRISSELIEEWIEVANLSDPIFSAFLKFRRSVNSEELMNRGFKDRELGLEIKRLEINNFKNLIDKE